MNIFYAIQATGNGHISRAMELLPFIQQYGNVDIFLSGSNANLKSNIPVTYKSKGVSLFYGNRGGLDYWKMMKDFSFWIETTCLCNQQMNNIIHSFQTG